jgi:alpha-1,2-mannosyltransferase
VTGARTLAGWLGRRPVFVVAAAYALSAGSFWLLAAGGTHFLDLEVYRMGGQAVIDGTPAYSLNVSGLLFTYPPFAAVLFAALAPLPYAVCAIAVAAAGMVALPVIFYLALRLPPVPSWLDARAALRLALAAAAVAVWLEPVQTTLGYGQVNLFLAVAVLYDLGLADASRWKGAAIGLAAGFKLTPAIFAIYYLATRRYRAAATSGVAFALSIALGFVVMPHSSALYWGGLITDTGRIGQLQDAANESLAGALARTLHTSHVTWAWLPLAAVVGLAGLALASRAQRRGNEAAGYSLCALTGLLISPVSWTHHWVIAVPALLIGAVAAYRARTVIAGKVGLAVVAALVIIGWTRLVRQLPPTPRLHLDSWQILISELYVLAALGALALAAWLAGRARQTTTAAQAGPAPAGDEPVAVPTGADLPVSRHPAWSKHRRVSILEPANRRPARGA